MAGCPGTYREQHPLTVTSTRHFYVRRAAEAEIAEGVAYYNGKHAALGLAFLAEVDRAFLAIRSAPERWPIWRSDRPYQKYLLRRFPFVVSTG
jgi:hypothetical protein